MKITAKVVPYSSVVGSSVTLHAESGMTICQLSLLSVIPPNFTFTPELHKQTSTRIAEWVAGALNGAAEFDAAPALENSKAPLADAHSKSLSSDLSSLRKGAEVDAAAAYDFVAVWHERQAKLFREMAEDDPRTAKPARDRAKEAAIHHAASAAALRNRAADDRRAALVSGSREERDG